MPVLGETKAFLKSYLEGKSESTKTLFNIALTHWENFTQQKPSDVESKDVDKFVYVYRKHLKSSSLSVYLVPIGKYLAWSGRKNLEAHIKKIRRNLDAEAIEESPPNHNDILKMLTKIKDLRARLIIRLLLFSQIPISCLKNLKVRHIYGEKNYEIPCKGKMISGILHSDTSKIIRRYITEKNLKENDRIIGIGEREIQYLIPDYAKEVGIRKKVTPKDLRKFGKDQIKRNWLIEIYEKDISQ